MGPITILDKSAFQALSYEEHARFRWYFWEVVTPMLVAEIAADLSKQFSSGRPPAQEVAVLARKFGGSGGPVSLDHRTLVIHSLLGDEVPMDGRVIPDNMTVVGDAALVDISPANETILRLADQRARESDQRFAQHWRQITRGLNFHGLQQYVYQHRVLVPRITSRGDAARVAAELLATAALQRLWLDWMLEDLMIPPDVRVRILLRWSAVGGLLQTFAPYAHHCLLALFTLFVAWKHHLISWEPTHYLDLQYMYYLPFCHVFVSDDRIHRFLAPLLVRPNQSFVLMKELKTGLREQIARWHLFSEHEQHLLRWALGSYPVPIKGNVVCALYSRHIPPWEPGRGNQAIKLTDDERRGSLALVERLQQDAGEPPAA